MIYDNDPDLSRTDDHRYFVGPRELNGVTATIQDNGLINADFFTEEHSSRGVAIHAALAEVARGGELFPFIDPDLAGWCQSGCDFLATLKSDGHEIVGVEVMRWHRLYGFAGQIDLVTMCANVLHVWDFKSGKAPKAARYQLGAYALLLPQDGKPIKKAAVELDRDGGRAKIIPYYAFEHFHDGATFLALLTASRTRQACGVK